VCSPMWPPIRANALTASSCTNEELDGAARRVRGPQQAVAQGLHVVGDLRVVHEGGVDAHLAHHAIADGALLLVREDGIRGVAKVG